MEALPMDLLCEEVLSRLPTKSVIRFMCVSKLWNSSLNTPEFAWLHRCRLTKNNKLLFNSSYGNSPCFFSLDQENIAAGVIQIPIRHDLQRELESGYGPEAISILCSCDGMVVCMVRFELILWNPSTQDYKKLPPRPRPKPCPQAYASREAWAFYYNESAKDYKILDVNEKGELYVYSLKADSWTCIGVVHEGACLDRFMAQGVVLNGFAYWIRFHQVGPFDYMILCLDLNEEKFKMLPFRDSMIVNGMTSRVVAYKGQLHVLTRYEFGKKIDLLRITSEAWEEVARVNLNSSQWKGRYANPICMTNDGQVFMVLEDGDNYQQLVTFDPKDHKITQNLQWNKIRLITMPLTYMETLVSPNHFGCSRTQA